MEEAQGTKLRVEGLRAGETERRGERSGEGLRARKMSGEEVRDE